MRDLEERLAVRQLQSLLRVQSLKRKCKFAPNAKSQRLKRKCNHFVIKSNFSIT
jgi:hypothetical protein